MNRNIAAVSPLTLWARRKAGSTSGLDQAELLSDQSGLLPHQIAPARDQGALEAHLRHRDTDRRDRSAAFAIAYRHADAAEVRHQLLDVEREAGLAHLRDLA